MQSTGTLATGDLRIDALPRVLNGLAQLVKPWNGTASSRRLKPLACNTVGEYTAGAAWGPQVALPLFPDAAKMAVRAAPASWSAVANIRFVEAADNASTHGTLRFAWTVSAVDERQVVCLRSVHWTRPVTFGFELAGARTVFTPGVMASR